MGVTGYPYDDYDGTDESFEKLIVNAALIDSPAEYEAVKAELERSAA